MDSELAWMMRAATGETTSDAMPLPAEGRHAYHAAQAVPRAGEHRAQAEERDAVRLRIQGESDCGEQRGHEHAAPAVEVRVVAVDEEHAEKRGQRAACEHNGARRVADDLHDIGLVHAERRARKAHVDEKEEEAARADDLLVVRAYELGHTHAEPFRWMRRRCRVRPARAPVGSFAVPSRPDADSRRAMSRYRPASPIMWRYAIRNRRHT